MYMYISVNYESYFFHNYDPHFFTNYAGDMYAMIDWVGEDSASVVKGVKVNNGCFRVGNSSWFF